MTTKFVLSFFKFSIAYFVTSLAIVFLSREQPVQVLILAWTNSVTRIPVIVVASMILLAVVVVGLSLLGRSARAVFVASVLAIAATVLFQNAFLLVKTSLPYILPFWADPFFADLDHLLHLGVDPWRLAHAVDVFLPMETLVPIYLWGWAIPAIFLPFLLALQDPDPGRVKRFLILYGVSWVIIGNLFALAGMSAGPVYYDRVMGTDRFAALAASLENEFMIKSQTLLVQERLWEAYAEDLQAFGSGISAFPSVHLSVAVVAALYLVERSVWMLPLAVLFVGLILFLSVYTGYHYAVDGYFSIIFQIGLWHYLRRRIAPHTSGRAAKDKADLAAP